MNQMKTTRTLRLFATLCFTLLLYAALAVPAHAYPINSNPDVDLPITRHGGSATVQVGATRDLNSFLVTKHVDEDGYDADSWYLVGSITWDSSAPAVISVSSGGVATANKVGYSSVTATFRDNMGRLHVQTLMTRATATAAADLTSSFTIYEGKFLDLSALLFPGAAPGSVTWSSTDSSIVKVDADGLVTGRSIGSGKVTASYTDAAGNIATQKVSIRVNALLLNEKSREITLTLNTGDKVDLIQLFYPSYVGISGITKGITATTSESRVVTVNGASIVAAAPGTCTITLRYTDANDETETQKFTIQVV